MPKDSHEQNYHTLTRVMILALILLTVGQVILYRNIQSVKSMISVTTMELKEGKGVQYERTNTTRTDTQNVTNTPKK